MPEEVWCKVLDARRGVLLNVRGGVEFYLLDARRGVVLSVG